MSARRGSPPTGSPPVATRHASADVVSETFSEKAKAIADKAVALAEGGDTAAMRLVFDRIAPAPKERAVRFTLPSIKGPEDLPNAVHALLQAAARGDLSPGEATQLAGVIEHYRRQTETADLAERIKALEEANAQKS